MLLLAGCAAPGARPSRFLEREPLTSCGEVELGQGEDIPQSARDCLEDTAGSELVVTRPTVEGEPVTEWQRHLAGGDYEYFTDMTQDSFGGGWWYTFCPRSEDDTAECRTEEL